MFQALESPGKTKKGKHQINKENGSCQQESANHHTDEEKQRDVMLGREVEPRPGDAGAGGHQKTTRTQASLPGSCANPRYAHASAHGPLPRRRTLGSGPGLC